MKKKLSATSSSNFALPFSANITSKTPKFRLFIAFVILGMLTCLSGCFNDATDNVAREGSVTGKIIDKDTGAAVPGINVKLIDNTLKSASGGGSVTAFGASINNAVPNSYFVEKATTGSDGVYLMSNIPDGNYSVVPGDISEINAASYELDGGTQSYSVILNGKSTATVNFARSINLIGSTSDASNRFDIKIRWNNLPQGSDIYVYRRHMALFIPFYPDEPVKQRLNLSFNTYTDFDFYYGGTMLFYTQENVFYFKIKSRRFTTGRESVRDIVNTPAIFLPLGSTPAKSTFDYDYLTNTMKQTQ